MEESNKKNILTIGFDEPNNRYFVEVATGSNVAESAFCVAVLIKCLIKDDCIKNAAEFLKLIKKYVEDPQYGEVEDDGTESNV